MAELLAVALILAALALLPILIFLPRRVRRCRFWCPIKRRDVEVELVETGPPGFRRAVGVKSCSAFFPANATTCGGHCLRGRSSDATKGGVAWKHS